MAKLERTNAMRLLDKNNIEYTIYSYDISDGKIDGNSVAQKTGFDPSVLYKTLIAQGGSNAIFVFVIPVSAELDLKKAAHITGVKKIKMLPVKNIKQITGYIRGGCSPVGMKKPYKTYIQKNSSEQEKVIVSAGKQGLQIELQLSDLQQMVHGRFCDVIK